MVRFISFVISTSKSNTSSVVSGSKALVASSHSNTSGLFDKALGALVFITSGFFSYGKWARVIAIG